MIEHTCPGSLLGLVRSDPALAPGPSRRLILCSHIAKTSGTHLLPLPTSYNGPQDTALCLAPERPDVSLRTTPSAFHHDLQRSKLKSGYGWHQQQLLSVVHHWQGSCKFKPGALVASSMFFRKACSLVSECELPRVLGLHSWPPQEVRECTPGHSTRLSLLSGQSWTGGEGWKIRMIETTQLLTTSITTATNTTHH